MPVTFSAEPMIVEEATRYAEHNGVTLEVLLFDYLKTIANRERQRKAATPRRKLGGLEGGFYMAPDFDEPLEDFKDYM